jgi:hypothetical protein
MLTALNRRNPRLCDDDAIDPSFRGPWFIVDVVKIVQQADDVAFGRKKASLARLPETG